MNETDLLRLHFDEGLNSSLRQIGRRAARLVGLGDLDATRVSTSISELARVAEGRTPVDVTFSVRTERSASGVDDTILTARVEFGCAPQDPDVPSDIHRSLARLMDLVVVNDDDVMVGKILPRPLSGSELGAVRDKLLRESAPDNHAVLHSLNTELVDTLTALRERETELVNLNVELDHTNRGVVALYAELERRALEVRDAQRAVLAELGDALRPPPMTIAGADLAVRYVPAEANSPTGGDLYDWFVLPDGTLHIALVDVRGHGVTGTRDALRVIHTVRTLILEGHPLDDVLQRADGVLQAGSADLVATALAARYEPKTGALRVAGAGHPPVLIVRADGSSGYLEARGRPIGYEHAGSRAVGTDVLEPGDTVLFYTDGLTEVRHDVIEGMQTLRSAASNTAARSLRFQLDATLSTCAGASTWIDDTTLLGLRRTAAAGPT